MPINSPNPDIGVNSYTPGFEKTFLGGLMSIELRLPMATTLDNNVFFDGTTNTSQGEIGDLALAVKGLLVRRDTFLLSGGLAMTVPTAQGSQYYLGQSYSNPLMTISNQSVHLMPFFGVFWTPNDRLFAVGYFQVDVDVNGDPVAVGDNSSPPTVQIGRFRDPTMLYVDLALGYWFRRSDSAEYLVTGLAPVVELHVNQSLDSSSSLSSFNANGPAEAISVTGAFDTFSNFDLTVGARLELQEHDVDRRVLRAADVPTESFDGEFRFLVNHRF